MEATGFTVNAHRFDPYKNFKFRILMDDRPVLGVSKVGPLKRTTEVVTHRSGGGDSHDFKSPGRTTYEGIMLERGRTHDLEFERWANMVANWDGDPAKNLKDYKKTLTLEWYNERGQAAMRYTLYGCWVSEYTAVPELDANANAVAIESIKIELEGWKRDPDTTEPDEGGAVPNG
ncbi:MAG: phage tail protein [Deltaproteobacteria bacterium]